MSTSPGKKCGKTAGKKGKGIVSKACVFCGLEEDNEELLGKRIKGAGLTVHNFCMLLSSGLCQRGTDKQGLLGFMPKDIQKEVNRGKKLSCSFCKQKGATVGCVVTSCRIKFHLHCGRNNGTLHQFFGRYQSFCPTHRPRQATLTSDRLAFFGTANTQCSICMCAVEARASNETLRSPCCRSSWFHRNCIQRLATTAGLHYLKCPLCNNRDVFQEEMLEFGIHIPDQDAAWELDPNAYQDLLERYSRCDAHKCCCPRGREYNKDLSKWEILVCVVCGSQGCHVECGQLPSHDIDWTCPDCEDIAKKVGSEKKTKKWKSKCDKKSTEGSLKAELRKEYERLQEKAKNFQSPPKPSASPEGSPGTSGCSSSKGGRYKSSPRGKRYREKVLRSAIKESDTRREEDSSSSDDDLPLKSPPKARRKLRSRKTRSTTISVQVSMSESEEPAEGRAKSPAEREESVSGSPKGSMHFEMAEQQPIKRRKRKKSMWSRGKYVVKQSTVKKRKLRPRSDSCSSGNAEVASLTSPKRSIGGSKSLVLSPAVIERIRAPSASFNSPDSDIAEDIDELEVVSSTDVEKTNVQQRRILRNYQKKNYKDGKTYARKSEKHQDSDKQSWGSLDMSLLDMVTLSEDEAPSEGEISASAVVSSTITGDPLPRVDTEPLAALSPLIITPLSWRPTPCNTEPEFIDLEDAMAVSSETAPNQDTATAETSGQGSEPRPTMLTKNRVFTEEIQTISSSSSAADDEDDEVVFVRAENTRQPHRYNGYVREWVNAAQAPQPNGQVPQQNGSTMGFHSIMTSRGLKLISTRCPPPIQPQAGPYTTSVMTPRGLRLVSSHPSHPPGNPIYHSAGYQYLSSIGNRWVPASTLSSHPSVIGGPYVNHSTNVVNNGGQINTTGAPSPAYVNTVAAAQKPSAPQPAKNTQNPQSAVVIDLTDSILEDTASDEIPNSEIQSDHNSTSQQPVPVGLFYNNNESESSKSPLKINKDALQTIRSVVVNKNGLSHPNENNRQMDSDKESLSGQSSDKGLNVRRKGAKLSLRKHAHKDAV